MPADESPPVARYTPLELGKLELDPRNPRFSPGQIEAVGGPLSFLIDHSNLLDLMESIAAQGFFPGEPIMVVQKGDNQNYVVIEGNRRVAACLLLSQPDLAPAETRRAVNQIVKRAAHKPTLLPALIFDRDTDILRYLGYRHISGVQEWSPLAKSRYVRRLFSETTTGAANEEARLAWVGARIGASATYVAKLLTSLAIYELSLERNFFGLALEPKNISFSLITVAIGRRAINQFLGLRSSKDFHMANLNEEALLELLDWIFVRRNKRTVLGDSRNIGLLAEVLEDKGNALATLRVTRNLEDAFLLTQYDQNAALVLLEDAHAGLEAVADILVEEDRDLRPEEITAAAVVKEITQRLIAGRVSTGGQTP